MFGPLFLGKLFRDLRSSGTGETRCPNAKTCIPKLEKKKGRNLEGSQMKYSMSLTIGDQKDLIHARRFLNKKEASFVRIAAYLTQQHGYDPGDNSYSVQAIAYWFTLAQLQNKSQSWNAMYTRHEHWEEMETDANK